MEADIKPIEIALVLLAELLFGIGYNSLVAWAMKHKLTHVSITVVVGVAITLLIPAVKWFAYEMPFYQAGIFLMLCFSASGLPMVVGKTLAKIGELCLKKLYQKSQSKWRKRFVSGIVQNVSAKNGNLCLV